MGANHARVLGDLPGVELVGVTDTDPDRVARATAGRTLPGFASAEALLREARPQMVSVVVPTGLHERVGTLALEAGAHVLIEKPIADSLPAARRLASLAESRGLVLAVGHIERFNPAVQELKRRLSEGQGGSVLQMIGRRVGPFPHRIRDVGVIHDLAPHDIDVMRYLLGDEVDRVYAESRGHINTDHEDMLAGMLHFEGGAMGILDINWLTPMKERTLTVLCQRGMFVIDYAAQSLCFYENFAAAAREGAIGSVTEGPMTRYPIANREPLRAELEAFRDSVAAGGPAAVTANDGIAALAVAEALVESASRHQPVSVHATA
jgi:predicted dehydrogenase